MASVVDLTGNIYSDLTVKFPFKYLRDNIYIMVMYDYDRNAILTEAMNTFEGK